MMGTGEICSKPPDTIKIKNLFVFAAAASCYGKTELKG